MMFTGALVYAVLAASGSLTVAQSPAQQANVGLAARADSGSDSQPDVFARAPIRFEPRSPAKAKTAQANVKAAGNGKANANAKAKTKAKTKAKADEQAGATKNDALAAQKDLVAQALGDNKAANGQQQQQAPKKKKKQNKKRDGISILEERQPYAIFEDETDGSN